MTGAVEAKLGQKDIIVQLAVGPQASPGAAGRRQMPRAAIDGMATEQVKVPSQKGAAARHTAPGAVPSAAQVPEFIAVAPMQALPVAQT